jgi:hypothetical protein
VSVVVVISAAFDLVGALARERLMGVDSAVA